MLTALEEGVRGGKWFSLIDKVSSKANLRSGFEKVKANRGSAGVDHMTIEMLEAHLEEHLERLSKSLQDGSYRPQAIWRVYISKPGSKEKRPLGIPTVRDRVVQAALRHVLEPIFERDFAARSFGFRPGLGCKDALRRVDGLIKAGHTWIVDADLKAYFDTIPHQRLLARVGTKVSDGRVLSLIGDFLRQRVMNTVEGWTPEEGTPQGAVVSPLLSNIYLDPLDHLMAEKGFEMVRYADDFVILCRSEPEAQLVLETVRSWVALAGLTLHPEKTRITDMTAVGGGFDFLGYHFWKGYRLPSKKSLRKVKDAIRAKTKRSHGHSLRVIISEVNGTLRGWFEYFKHSRAAQLVKLDKFVRQRLRGILRGRRGIRGKAHGLDNYRWPIAFFAGQGLFSLAAAHVQARRSSPKR